MMPGGAPPAPTPVGERKCVKPPPAAVCRFSARWLCLKGDGRGGDDSARFCLYQLEA